MCLLDTIDGALMMTLYTSTSLARDTVAILYYSIVLTAITVLVAVAIGSIQLLSLAAHFEEGTKFAENIDKIGDHYDVIGGAICGAFVVTGLVSVLVYGPWRKWVERRRAEGKGDVEMVGLEDGEMKENAGGEKVVGVSETRILV